MADKYKRLFNLEDDMSRNIERYKDMDTYWAKEVYIAGAATITVDGALTDTELRATAVPVSGPVTDVELRATAVPTTESSPLTTIDTVDTARAASTGHVHEPSAATAAVVTLAAAGAGVSNVLGMVAWSYDDDPTAGSLTIEDGSGSTVFKVDITSKGPGFIPFTPPKKGTANTAMIATLASGGGSVSGVCSVHAWTE